MLKIFTCIIIALSLTNVKLAFAIGDGAIGSHAIGGVSDMVIINKNLLDTHQNTLTLAKKIIERLNISKHDKDTLAAVIYDAEIEYGKIQNRFQEFEEVALRVEKEKNSLDIKQTELKKKLNKYNKDAKKLESDKKFFETGFYSALAIIFIGIFSVCFKAPLWFLDIRLKKLEIKKKEKELASNQ